MEEELAFGTKSPLVTRFQTGANKLNDPRDLGGSEKVIKTTFKVLAADDDGAVYAICPVRTSWKIHSILLLNDAITGASDYDCGLYDQDEAVIDKDCYTDGLSIASGNATPAEIGFHTRAKELVGNEVWQDPTTSPVLTADPQEWWFLCLTANTVGSAEGDVTVIVKYTDGQ